MVAERLAHLIRVHLEQGHVARAGAGDQHVVDRVRQLVEESLQRGRIGGVEGGGAPRADVARRPLEALGIAAGEDDVGALAAGAPGGLEADPGAAADQDDGLAEQFRVALGHDRLAICASIGVTGRGMSAISMRSAFSAAS